MDLHAIGKMLVGLGLVIIVVGVIVLIAHKIPFIGKLPGDIYIKKDSFSFYFPLATSLVISVILSLVLWFFSRR